MKGARYDDTPTYTSSRDKDTEGNSESRSPQIYPYIDRPNVCINAEGTYFE